MATVNEKLLDKFIRHSVYLERLKMGEARRLSVFLGTRVYPAAMKKVEASLTRGLTARRRRELAAALDIMMKAGAVKAGKLTIESLQDLAQYEAEWTAETIRRTVPIDIDLTMPSVEAVRQVVTTKVMEGHKLTTWLNAHSAAARAKMMKQVDVGIASGESVANIGRRIRQVVSLKRKQSEYIARTAVSAVVNNARQEIYKRNSDLIKNVQWVSTLDTRTSLTCINLDGQVFSVTDGPRPPAHFNCRSTTIPVIAAWNELGIEPPPPGTRASMNGAVPDKTTYKDWFKKQTKATKVEVLGPKRYKLYKSGASVRSFVNKDYQTISLRKLKSMEAQNA